MKVYQCFDPQVDPENDTSVRWIAAPSLDVAVREADMRGWTEPRAIYEGLGVPQTEELLRRFGCDVVAFS